MSPNATPKVTAHHLDENHCNTLKPGPLYGCLHIPDYPVQAFVRNEPELRRRPVVVLDGTFPLFTVISANMFARRIGIRIGMTKLQLERFSGLTVRYRSREQEDSTHHALLDCGHYFTPRVEDTATDTITLDLNGLSGLWGTPRAMAQKLFRAADKLGLEAHIAMASNPDAAIHAAKAEAGITVIAAGDEMKKLQPLDLQILSPSEEIEESLNRWGLRTFEDLAQLSKVHVAERLGQEGVRLQQMARGETTRPLRVLNEKPYFKESMELEHSIYSLEPLTFLLSRLLNQICQRLSARNRSTNELRLALTLEPPFDKKRVSENHASKDFLRAMRLPVPIRDPKVLLKLLQLDLDAHRPPRAIVGITLTAEPVEPRPIQNGLFLPLAPEPEKLELTLARIGSIVGDDNIGSPQLLDTHRPDAFRLHRFAIPVASAAKKSTASKSVSLAIRLCRPPRPISVEMQQGQPSQVFFPNKSGKVTARGPWNTSGEWWRDAPWNREEWDVEVQSGRHRTLYRIYHDCRTGQWFVDGTYD